MSRELILIVWTSLWVCGVSVALAALFSLPAGFIIAAGGFAGKKVLVVVLNTLMSMPTVVIGLLVYSFISSSGPLGNLRLLYTPCAMIIGQFVLAAPIITALVVSAADGADERIKKTAFTLGAGRLDSFLVMLFEARTGIAAAVVAGFGRVFSEVGVSMMLGGNIKNYTRNITTAIAFETTKGEFALGLILGAVLLFCAFLINITFQLLTRQGR